MIYQPPIVNPKTVPKRIAPNVWEPISLPPEWLLDPTLLRVLYKKVRDYRVKGQRTKKRAVKFMAEYPSVYTFTAYEVTAINLQAFGRPYEIGFHISFGDLGPTGFLSHIYVRVDNKLRVITGAGRSYDGSPLANRHWHKLRMFVTTKAIYNYWKSLTAHLYAPGGKGEKRDREEYEEAFRHP